MTISATRSNGTSVAKFNCPKPTDAQIEEFRQLVWREGRVHWRDLPWRGIDDDYAVLVSEVMLQQTQVKRVLRYWERFLALFPTIDALAAADNALVLEMWQGLGYNRRALMLKRCAEECATHHGGTLPAAREELLGLPGIGPATASGVMAFARNERCVYLETNVRSVFLHHFFPGVEKVPDKDVATLVERACPAEDVRGWYYALLDYGAHLKSVVSNPSRRSSAYARQSTFEGSHRQKRAAIVRLVLGEPGIGFEAISAELDAMERAAGRGRVEGYELSQLLAELVAEGFFAFDGRGYRA